MHKPSWRDSATSNRQRLNSTCSHQNMYKIESKQLLRWHGNRKQPHRIMIRDDKNHADWNDDCEGGGAEFENHQTFILNVLTDLGSGAVTEEV